MLLQAAADLSRAYDAIIVDEGQDFAASWYDSIQCLLRDLDQNFLYVFYDPCQRIYPDRKVESWHIDEIPHSLVVNCRNTKRINEFVADLACIEPYSAEFCFEGSAVELHTYEESGEQVATIDSIVSKLLREGLTPSQIVILSHHKQSKSCLAGMQRIAGKPLV